MQDRKIIDVFGLWCGNIDIIVSSQKNEQMVIKSIQRSKWRHKSSCSYYFAINICKDLAPQSRYNWKKWKKREEWMNSVTIRSKLGMHEEVSIWLLRVITDLLVHNQNLPAFAHFKKNLPILNKKLSFIGWFTIH